MQDIREIKIRKQSNLKLWDSWDGDKYPTDCPGTVRLPGLNPKDKNR